MSGKSGVKLGSPGPRSSGGAPCPASPGAGGSAAGRRRGGGTGREAAVRPRPAPGGRGEPPPVPARPGEEPLRRCPRPRGSRALPQGLPEPREEMGRVRRGRATPDPPHLPPVPRASPVPPGQAPHLVLLQLLHQHLGRDGQTHKGRESGARSAAAPPPAALLPRPVPVVVPVPSPPAPARPQPPAPRSPGRISCRVRTAGTGRSGSRALRRGEGRRGHGYNAGGGRRSGGQPPPPAIPTGFQLGRGGRRRHPPQEARGGGEVADGAPGRRRSYCGRAPMEEPRCPCAALAPVRLPPGLMASPFAPWISRPERRRRAGCSARRRPHGGGARPGARGKRRREGTGRKRLAGREGR